MRRRLALIVTCIATLAPASAAHAGFFAATPIDGPNPAIESLGDVDVARDGTGALAYLRREGGVAHVFVSRLVGGVFGPPEQVDQGLPGEGAQPAVAASDGGRVVVVFISGGTAFAVVRAAGAPAWTAPQPLANAASSPSVDMSINGVAYATFTTSGDVRAARLERNQTNFTVLDQPLDINQPADAGAGTNRSRVAISADGTGVAVWGEGGHVYARRLYDGQVSTAPVDLTMGLLDGHAGGAADSPDVDIEDDSSFAWIVFRQVFDDGGVPRPRAIGVRLRGSRLEQEGAYDGLGWGGASAETPHVALNGKGVGIVTTGATNGAALAGVIKDDLINQAVQLGGNGSPSQPHGAVAEGTARVAGWVNVADGTALGSFYDDRLDQRAVPPPGPPALLSNPDFGPVDPQAGFDVSGDRTGDFAYAFIQGTGADRRLVAAYYDRAPISFSVQSTSRLWRNVLRSPVSWSAPLEQWGAMTYSVVVDGKPVAQTQQTRTTLPPGSVTDGIHMVRVIGTDIRGQSVQTPLRTLKVDTLAPEASFSVQRKKRVVTVKVKASDVVPPAGQPSGVKRVRIDFGDGSGLVEARKAVHAYRRSGTFTVRVSAADGAGNTVVVRRTIHVKAK